MKSLLYKKMHTKSKTIIKIYLKKNIKLNYKALKALYPV